MAFQVTKTYGHERGLSACFRQWRAKSHCRFLHGYALSFSIVFESETLNENNWVIDFGSLKPVKLFLDSHFDHRLAVAQDDPDLTRFLALQNDGNQCADVLVLDRVGCEAFAEFVGKAVVAMVEGKHDNNVKVKSVTCAEHGSNSATWINPGPHRQYVEGRATAEKLTAVK